MITTMSLYLTVNIVADELFLFFFVDILLDVVFAVAAVDVVLAAVPVPLDATAKTPQRGILLPVHGPAARA